MTAYLPLVSLIAYPIIAMILVGQLSEAKVKRFCSILLGVNIATIWGAMLHLYTIWPLLNTFLATLLYFNLCTVVALAFLNRSSITKVTGLLGIILVFGLGYLMAIYGMLGTGFASSDGQKEIVWLAPGITFEQTPLGSNVTKYRGLKVEVYRQVAKFPLLKLRLVKKSYFDTILPYCPSVNPTYSEKLNTVTISCTEKDRYAFVDTLVLKK